jgi:hypothetical protein
VVVVVVAAAERRSSILFSNSVNPAINFRIELNCQLITNVKIIHFSYVIKDLQQ